MAINLGLNIKTKTKTDHTVTVVASSGVTLATIDSSTKRLTVSATENVYKEICTITFKANTGFYYSKEPHFKSNFQNGDLIITDTVVVNSLDRTIEKVFTISAKASVNTIYNNIIFNENISQGETSGVNNTQAIEITGIFFDLSNVPAAGGTKSLVVNGSENSQFVISAKRASDNKSYDFESNTFTQAGTDSPVITIDSSGVSETSIVIPSGTTVDTYVLEMGLAIGNPSVTVIPNSLTKRFEFNQLNNVTVSFACVSANSSYSGTHGSLPSSATITGTNSSSSTGNTVVNLQPKLNTKAFKKTREIQLSDFETRTTSTAGGGTDTASVVLSSSNASILVGMKVTGVGITNDVTVAAISGTSLTLSGVPGGTINETVALTFTGAGTQFIQQITGLVFSITDVTATSNNIATLLVNNVNKLINANSTGTTITLATNTELDDNVNSVVGLYEGVSTVASGVNIGDRTITSVNSDANTAVINSSATVKSGQVISFEKAGRVAQISFLLNIVQFPTQNTVVSLNLDNFLTIDPGWS